MKTQHLMLALCTLLAFGLFAGCEKMGMLSDDDSDRPDWANGNTELNPHINQNDSSGVTRGGDYGDLYVLLRDENGVPVMRMIGTEWYVQPVAEDGVTPLELNSEGELVDPLLATEVDFGRLSIVRAPQSVLDQAFEESMKALTAPGAIVSLDYCGRLTSTYFEDGDKIIKTIDSPRENMALYQYIMTNMFEGGLENRLSFLKTEYGFDPLTIAASCFAAGSDKTGDVIIDEVVYTNGFIDCIGLNPILNEHEYDFNHDYKWYFNYGDCYGDGQYMYRYNRDVYKDRYIQFLVDDNNVYWPIDPVTGISDSPKILSIWEVMELGGLFSQRWSDLDPVLGYVTHVKGFAAAIDDAVQVIELVHGDSNIIFLPDYTP